MRICYESTGVISIKILGNFIVYITMYRYMMLNDATKFPKKLYICIRVLKDFFISPFQKCDARLVLG